MLEMKHYIFLNGKQMGNSLNKPSVFALRLKNLCSHVPSMRTEDPGHPLIQRLCTPFHPFSVIAIPLT